MSRHRKAAAGAVRKLNDDDRLKLLEQGLDTLAHLVKIFDDGYDPISFNMSVEIYKILVENKSAVSTRSRMRFSTPRYDHGPQFVSAYHRLNSVEAYNISPEAYIAFRPKYLSKNLKIDFLIFRDWWSRDKIFIASASPPGTRPGMVPMHPSVTIPFDQRVSLTRMQLVSILRNKLGAHSEDELPKLLDDLDDDRSWGDLQCHTDNGILKTQDGSLEVRRRQLPAMMRQIAHEVLEAYGRDDSSHTPESKS